MVPLYSWKLLGMYNYWCSTAKPQLIENLLAANLNNAKAAKRDLKLGNARNKTMTLVADT